MVPQNPPGSPATVDFAGIDVPGPGRLRTEVLGTPGLFGGPDGNNPNFHLSSHGSAWDGLGTTNFQQTDIESPPVIANTFFVDAGGGTRLLTVIGPQALSFTFLDFLFGDAQSFDVNVWFRPQSQTPIADAGPDQVMESAMVVQLDGRGSTDPDGDPLSYLWTQISGPGVTLSNVNSPVPLFKTPIVSANTDVEFSLTVNDGVVSTPDTVIVTITPPLGGPELVAATVAEINTLDLMLQAGDRIFLTFDQPVNVPTTNVQDAHFTITTAGTTFSGSTIRNSLRDPKTLVIQLGFSSSGIVVGGAGVGSTALGILPSGGLAITNPLTSLPAVVTTPGEEIDLRWRYLGVPGMIGPAGGVVGVDPDVVNYELTQLGLTIPAGALAAETEFELRSVPSALEGLGLPTAIHITTDAADPVNLFQIPATLTLQYRDFDIDFRAGQIEGLMRVFQLTSGGPVSLEQSGVSGARLRPLTNGTQDGGANTVQVQLDGLDPGDTGTVGTFATLPVNPVEERSILIKPSGAAGGAAVLTLPGAPALSPEGNSGYLLHTIEFPGYEAATIEDDDRIQATLRAATLFDRTAIMLSNTSFPAQSGAVFVIETKDATGFPVSFTDPVNLEVEFMDRGDPTLTDTVELTGAQGLSLQMRLVRSATATADGANFALFGGAQAVDLGSSLVTESGVTPLTDANGLAVWGAAVDPLVSLPSVDDLLDHILGITELTGDDLMNADLNGDGEVDAADVVSLVGN
jgi:hypothetical protein